MCFSLFISTLILVTFTISTWYDLHRTHVRIFSQTNQSEHFCALRYTMDMPKKRYFLALSNYQMGTLWLDLIGQKNVRYDHGAKKELQEVLHTYAQCGEGKCVAASNYFFRHDMINALILLHPMLVNGISSMSERTGQMSPEKAILKI